MRAVITAGGTSEPIDDVRVLSNLSRGRFGAYIANALVERGVQVTLLASRALMAQPGWVDPRVRRVGFGSFAELDAALQEHTRVPPELLFMAAAVSDYSPVRAPGKIRSKSEALVLHLSRNPKLLSTLRQRCGPGSFLVGFKLLSGVSDAELIAVARAQLEHGSLDLCVANDLAKFGPGLHPVVLVDAQEAVAHRTSKAQAATLLVDEVLGRVGWEPRGSGWVGRVRGVSEVRRLGSAVALPTATVAEPELGGGADEVAAAYRALGAAALSGSYRGGAFSVLLPDGALLLGLADAAVHDRRCESLLGAHARLGGEPALHRQPVYDGAVPVGVWAQHEGGSTLWHPEAERSPLRSDRFAQCLAGRRVRLLARSPAERDFWAGHGFMALSTDPAVWLSPAMRGDLRQAASAALVDPIGRSVLLGRRLTGAGAGLWAFPGGRVQVGESPAAAAARELYEETGLDSPPGPPFYSASVHVGDGEQAWRVHSHAWLHLDPPEPVATRELESRWVPFEQAGSLALAPGMRAILYALERVLGG